MKSPLEVYQLDVAEGRLMPDQRQAEAITRLNTLYLECLKQVDTVEPNLLAGFNAFFRGMLKPIFGQKNAKNHQSEDVPKAGLYIWGGVGRGKTYLMDCFYDALPFQNKLRIHFHRFMQNIHHQLQQEKGQVNPLEKIARRYAAQYKIICLDEFVVIDITDAMLLGQITIHFFEFGLKLVTTSNVPPSGLYKDGLQRSRFLPAIAALERHLDVYHLDSPTDFRLRSLSQHNLFVVGPHHQSELSQIYKEQSHYGVIKPGVYEILGRNLDSVAQDKDCIWFDFKAICGGPRSVADYIILAKEFHMVIVSGVPQMDNTIEDEARRFIHLIDALYDSRVKLIVGSEVNILELYKGEKLTFEFERTTSRLIEMQSKDYLSLPHRIEKQV